MIFLRLHLAVDEDRIGKSVGQSLATHGDIFDPNVVHVLHFQLDAIIKGLRTSIEELRDSAAR